MTETRSVDDQLASRTQAKVTRRTIPLLMLLYFVAYLDRVNIAFAGPNGMNHDLALTSTMFGFAAGIFFLGYLLFEVPSNLILYRVGARRWISRIVVVWGVIATATAFVVNDAMLIVLRILLGVAESGFFPGIILYLTFWFPSAKRAQAISWFMVALPISTVAGSMLSATLIRYADGTFGLAGWRVMFLFEGMPAVLLAIATFYLLPDRPETATWLADDEREWLASKLSREAERSPRGEQWSLWRSLTHRRVLILCAVDFGLTYGLYSLGFFLPTILGSFAHDFGTNLSIVQRGGLTAIPYVFGAVAMLLWARWNDRRRARHRYIAIPMLVGGAAIPVALYLSSPWLAIAAVSVCAMGVCAALPAFWALPSDQLPGPAAASGLAAMSSIGNSAGFFAPYITGWLADATGSQRPGLWLTGAAMFAGGLMIAGLRRRAGTDQTLVAP